jgi:predicted nucleic acid-binding protein
MLEVLLQSAAAHLIGQRLFAVTETLHVPHLMDLEIAQALRRLARAGVISNRRAEEALADLGNLPLTRYPHLVLLPRIWQLRQNATAYDSAYLALAEMLDAPLVTRDQALARVGSHARVEVI